MAKKKPTPKPKSDNMENLIRAHIAVEAIDLGELPDYMLKMCCAHRVVVSRHMLRVIEDFGSGPTTRRANPDCQQLSDMIAALNAQVASIQATYNASGCPVSGDPYCPVLELYLQSIHAQIAAANAAYQSMGCS